MAEAAEIAFPPSRPEDYDPDKIWTPPSSPVPGNTPSWQDRGVSGQEQGGGRWRKSLVVVANDTIYFEALM